MSIGTNRERIEQNNIKLEEIKGKIDKLPEYQDIKPIYAITDYSNFKISSYDTINYLDIPSEGYSRLDDYIIIRFRTQASPTYWSDVFLYKIQPDNTLKLLTRFSAIEYYTYYYKIFAKTDNKLYIMWEQSSNGANNIHVYVYHIDTGVLDSSKNIPLQERFRVDECAIIDNGVIISMYDDRRLTKYVFDTDTDTIRETVYMSYSSPSSIPPFYIGNNIFMYYSTSSNITSSQLYKISGSTIISSDLIKSDSYSFNGLSYDETKIFMNGNCYSTDENLNIGELLAENVCGRKTTIYTLNNKYYIKDNTLCTFDNETNTFSSILSLNRISYRDNYVFGFDEYKNYVYTGLTLFDFSPSDRMIGFTYNGIRYPIDNEGRLKANYILSGNSAYTYEGNKLLGTMQNNGQLSYTPSAVQQTIPAGYTSGGTVAGDSNLVANNIRLGTTIFGVEGNLEADKPDQTKTATPTTEEQVITPDTGYELASVTVGAVTSDIDSNIVSENIKKDVSILGVTGTLESGGSSDYNARLVPTNGKIISYITEISAQLDTSSVTDMSYMFDSCTNLTTIPLLDTSKVTNMKNMFINCTSLTTIPLLDTSNVNDMRYMFDSCTNLTTIPLLDTSKVTTMQFMFNNCENLTTIPLLDTSNVGNMPYMFDSCTNLTTVPQLDTSSVISMNRIFNNCTSLSDESLNNILAMCKNAVKITSNKTLKNIGLTSEQATKCTTLSNYSAFTAAGWTTGY